MLRLFRGIDGRITDHVINFYMPEGGVAPRDELSQAATTETRQNLEKYVSRLGDLVAEKTRVAAIRALMGGIIWDAFDEGAFFREVKGGQLTAHNRGKYSMAEYSCSSH